MLSVLYLVSHLDRANIGNAKIAGLTEDLGLSGIQYNIALSLFFIPYVLLGESKPGTFLSKDLQANLEPEVPSNILLKTFTQPSHYLGILIVSWGIIMTLTGVVQNFGGLLAVRILLGIFEYIIPARRI
jgi:hypothetical protein